MSLSQPCAKSGTSSSNQDNKGCPCSVQTSYRTPETEALPKDARLWDFDLVDIKFGIWGLTTPQAWLSWATRNRLEATRFVVTGCRKGNRNCHISEQFHLILSATWIKWSGCPSGTHILYPVYASMHLILRLSLCRNWVSGSQRF